MKRFPLYAKILLWFLLNLVVLAAGFGVLFRAQFRFGPDLLLAGGANERIEAAASLIFAELDSIQTAQWNSVLDRFGSAYGVEFFLFRNDGAQLAGEGLVLPPEVRTRLPEPRGPGQLMPESPEDRMPGPPFGPRRRLGPGFGRSAPLEAGFPRSPRPKTVVRTSQPTCYWVLLHAALRNEDRPRVMPVTLILKSPSLSGGGLFFDFKPWLWLGVGSVLFSALLWLPLVRSITRSIAQMTAATGQIAQGRFDVRVDERRRDELGSLGRSINQMAAQLAGYVQGQKRFLGDVAHELCSPLAKLRTALGILEERAGDDHQTYVRVASEKAGHIASLVNELLSFSKAALGASTLKLQPVSVAETVERALRRENPDGASIERNVPAGLWVKAEPELLTRALANVVRNALRYAGHAGPITVRAVVEKTDVIITVADSGPGVPETELARILEPFYRVDTSRDQATGGVGLGLAIVKTCVESCGGTIACRNRKPAGLEVELRLPRAEPSAEATS
ncbi:MAG: HAMP domain-containing histidine kinase [Verrucomicrobia bacterium]|nr:HAMP domain-containing histidine kinase [Verrucomicrobiota bacterium]